MNSEELEILEESTNQDIFMNNMNAILSVKTDYEKREYDYEWIDIIDETLPYIDNILNSMECEYSRIIQNEFFSKKSQKIYY